MFDIFFLSFDEPNADANWILLKSRFPRARRVEGIVGLGAAHRACSELAETPMYFLVDADNVIAADFDFDRLSFEPDLQSVYVWRCLNPVNGLVYGYGGVKLFPRGLFSDVPSDAVDFTTTVAPRYVPVFQQASTTVFNSSPLQAWRSAFRECAKLASQNIKDQKTDETQLRLDIWTSTTLDVSFAEWALLGARQGREFGETYKNSVELKSINDFAWLEQCFARAQSMRSLLSKENLRPEDVSSTFCLLPWVHLSTRPNGHMRVCCTANASSVGKTNDKEWGGEVGIVKREDGKPANLNHTDLLDGWNNSYMKNVRVQMLAGQKPPSCLKCYREEEAGHKSKRQWETAYWWERLDAKEVLGDTQIDGSVPPKLYYIDLRLGTKCNLKCVMCSPHDSSMWVSDWKKLHPQILNPALKETMEWNNQGRVDGATYNWHQNNPRFWEQLYEQIPHMRQLYFAGGESTIIKEHYELLEECIRRGEAGHIELRYNSNAIETPERLFELWKHFQRVRFHFSLDSIGEMNSYIRYPSPWDQIERQLRRFDETEDQVEVTIACAVQALNIYYIPDFIRWKLDQNYKKINVKPLGAGLINYHFVYHPPHLNVKILPPWFKQKITEKMHRFCDELRERFADDPEFLNNPYGIERLKGLVRFMNSEDWSNRMPEFVEYIQRMDTIRGTDFKKVFPEMAPLLEEAQKSTAPRSKRYWPRFLFGRADDHPS